MPTTENRLQNKGQFANAAHPNPSDLSDLSDESDKVPHPTDSAPLRASRALLVRKPQRFCLQTRHTQIRPTCPTCRTSLTKCRTQRTVRHSGHQDRCSSQTAGGQFAIQNYFCFNISAISTTSTHSTSGSSLKSLIFSSKRSHKAGYSIIS